VGGGIWSSEDDSVTNNTLFQNSATSEGGGICCSYIGSDDRFITNTILWDNSAPSGSEIFVDPNADPTFSYCNIKGGWPGTGNIDEAPVLSDPASGDFHLNWDSPCKDAGDPDAPSLPAIDFEGDPRSAGDNVDIGADEFHVHLYSLGEVIPGESIMINFVGERGEPVTLAQGGAILDPPFPIPHGDLFIWPIANSWFIGTVPGNGIKSLTATVPAVWVPGEEYPFQAHVGAWGDPDTLLTNLLVLDVE